MRRGKMNRSVRDVGGALLLVPQFTLVADTSAGLRPSFSRGAPPDAGARLFDRAGGRRCGDGGAALLRPLRRRYASHVDERRAGDVLAAGLAQPFGRMNRLAYHSG